MSITIYNTLHLACKLCMYKYVEVIMLYLQTIIMCLTFYTCKILNCYG